MSSSFERSIVPPMAQPLASNQLKVYRPKQSKAWRFGLTFIVIGLVGLLALLPTIMAWWSGGPMLDGKAFLLVALFLLLLLGGVFWIVNTLRGFPRLTLTPEGISHETGMVTRTVSWSNLGPFKLLGGWAPVLECSAPIVGSAAHGDRLGRKSFAIADFFQTPMEQLIPTLNAARAAALGVSHPAIATRPAPVGFAVGLTRFTAPWLTLAILALLIVVFAIENLFPVTPGEAGSPSVATLIAMGGVSRSVLTSGEWYRLFTAPLLHGGILHIVANGIALLLGGRLLERLIGRAWFFACFTIGAVGGSLMSIAVNPPNLVSVGVSGALMGMFATLFVSGFHMPAGSPARQRLQINSMQVLIPSLFPLFSFGSGLRVDFAAHFGGAIAGALIAAVLLAAWPRTEQSPRLRGVAVAISFLGALLFIGSAGLATANYARYDIETIPQAELPKDAADAGARAADLAKRYPNDPLSHLFLALTAGNDAVAAERELRIALAHAQAHAAMFRPRLEVEIRARLAILLDNQHRTVEAQQVARPVCSATAQDTETWSRAMLNRGLCQ